MQVFPLLRRVEGLLYADIIDVYSRLHQLWIPTECQNMDLQTVLFSKDPPISLTLLSHGKFVSYSADSCAGHIF